MKIWQTTGTPVVGVPWRGNDPRSFVSELLLAIDVPCHACHCHIPYISGFLSAYTNVITFWVIAHSVGQVSTNQNEDELIIL